jgi:hypothetical protein
MPCLRITHGSFRAARPDAQRCCVQGGPTEVQHAAGPRTSAGWACGRTRMRTAMACARRSASTRQAAAGSTALSALALTSAARCAHEGRACTNGARAASACRQRSSGWVDGSSAAAAERHRAGAQFAVAGAEAADALLSLQCSAARCAIPPSAACGTQARRPLRAPDAGWLGTSLPQRRGLISRCLHLAQRSGRARACRSMPGLALHEVPACIRGGRWQDAPHARRGRRTRPAARVVIRRPCVWACRAEDEAALGDAAPLSAPALACCAVLPSCLLAAAACCRRRRSMTAASELPPCSSLCTPLLSCKRPPVASLSHARHERSSAIRAAHGEGRCCCRCVLPARRPRPRWRRAVRHTCTPARQQSGGAGEQMARSISRLPPSLACQALLRLSPCRPAPLAAGPSQSPHRTQRTLWAMAGA